MVKVKVCSAAIDDDIDCKNAKKRNLIIFCSFVNIDVFSKFNSSIKVKNRMTGYKWQTCSISKEYFSPAQTCCIIIIFHMVKLFMWMASSERNTGKTAPKYSTVFTLNMLLCTPILGLLF